MIDIHSHLLYGVDDGASKIEDSIRMLSEAQKAGIKYIISTTHYQDDLYESEKLNAIYVKLINRALDFGITLKMGFEVYMTKGLETKFNKRCGLTLNDSKYMLIEFPFSELPWYSFETLYNLYLNGITPIISHPERCRFFIENKGVLDNFLESGFLIQLDAASILGVYGNHVKVLCEQLLKAKKVSFIASNAHFPDDYRDWYLKAFYKVKKLVGTEYTDELFHKNSEEIINAGKNNLSTYVNA